MDTNLREYISDYYKPVQMPGGYTDDTVDILNTADLYYNSKFKTGNKDSRGFRKFFYNIVKTPCDVARKFIDLSTKHIILKTELPDIEERAWLMMHDLKNWLKLNNFGKLLNVLAHDLPKYGHIFIKKDKTGKWNKVSVHNMRFNPASESFETDTWFAEAIEMTPREILKMNWNGGDDIKTLLESGQSQYLVYECYERNKKSTGKEWVRKFYGRVWDVNANGSIVRGTETIINQKNQDYLGALVLHEDETEELPYREHKFEEMPGRRLGKGFVELLFENQIAENDAENLERKGLYYTSLHIFQTRDEMIGNNMLTSVENGDIIKTSDTITPIAMEERNLPAYNATRQRWSTNTAQKTFSSDIATGGPLPSRTPNGVANIQASMISSFFDLQKENYGLFIHELMLNDVIPSFKKDYRKRHVLTLAVNTSGLEKLLKAYIKQSVLADSYKYALRNGFFPSIADQITEEQRLMQDVKNKKNIGYDIPDNFYDDAKFTMDIVVTGEQVDTAQVGQTLTVALQMISTNPAIIQNKGTRTMLFKLLEMQGVSPIDLNIMQEEVESSMQELPGQQMQQLPQGGSVAVPQGPSQGPSQQVV